MEKPQLILELEKELNCSFVLVELSEISFKENFGYSINDANNITGLAIVGKDLEEIPRTISENVAHLYYLTSLNLVANMIRDISPLKELRNIIEFNLSENQIADISFLKNLNNVQYLSLKNIHYLPDAEIRKIEEIRNKKNEAKENQDFETAARFRDIEFKYIYKTQHLDNKQWSVISELKSLKSIDLSNNSISDISFIKNLRRIEYLDFENNKISDLQPLVNLTNLKSINLNNNSISDLQPIANLTNLRYIDIDNNKIKKIANSVLEKLIPNDYFLSIEMIMRLKLKCVKNQQFEKAAEVRDIELELIQKNEISAIQKSKLYEVFFELLNNPIESPPIEILKQGKAAIKAWFAANKKKLNEIKVLLVGDAEAGKTSICKRLKESTFDKHEKQTNGIKIEKLVFSDLPSFSQQIQLHGLSAYVWDFGGQEIMTNTHRFFLTNRSIYILVLEARNDKSTETQIHKWLENITTQGGNSPVIIAVNKIDVNPAFDIDLYNLEREFPQIAGYVRISCEKDENINELKQLLEIAIPKAELFNTEIDERWLKIKDELQEKTRLKHKINESDYTEICNKHELANTSEQNQCVRFLHDLGIVLHFENLDLAEYYILDPLWVTTGVYRIITSEKAAKASGVISYEDLKEIANTIKNETEVDEYSKIAYTNFESRYLADIMEEFKLCFFASEKKLMLIPDLFKKETPALEVEKIIHSKEKLELIYDYPFLHHTVISRLIVAINGEIQEFWRSGVIITSKSLNATSLVRALNDQIQITVTGDKKDKRQYLSQIRYFVNQINEEFKLKPTLLIPLSENSFIEYEILVEMEREGEKTYRDYKLKKTYQISQLLEGIESNEEIQRQSATIVNNYHTINVNGMNNKVIQDAVKITENSNPSIENISEIHNLELLIDKKAFLAKELITTYDSEKKFALQQQIRELENRIMELKK